MIKIVRGNIIDADVQALVNTVNTVGIMGRGIALQFKRAFPDNYEAYRKVCEKKQLETGMVYTYEREQLYNPRYIINFPTKRHWKSPSKMEYIESGLMALVQEITRLKIESIAIPPLGCGLGGLNWNEVYKKIEETLRPLNQIDIYVFEPAGSPKAEKMKNCTSAPPMTSGRAALLSLMKQYLKPLMDDEITLLEIHKLLYFLQVSGEPLRLNYIKGFYGPYATNLHNVLERMEGHFISGYGDGTEAPGKVIEFKKEAVQKAEEFIKNRKNTLVRFCRIEELILGFETPYGLELLASVHWVAVQEKTQQDIEKCIQFIHSWNERKRNILKTEHIRVTWKRLHDLNWF